MHCSMRFLLSVCLLNPFQFAKLALAEESDQTETTEEAVSDENTEQEVTQEQVQQVEQTSRSDSSSHGARLNKKASLELRLGLIVGTVPGSGFGALFHKDQNLHIGLSHVSGSLDLADEIDEPRETEVVTADLNASVTQIFARYYLGNSFYLSGGIGQRKVEADMDVRSRLFDHKIEGSIKADSTTLNVSIGNAWSWDGGFFIGCEWVGLMVPLSNSNSGDLTLSGTGVEEDQEFKDLKKDTEDLAKLLGETTMASLLVLHLGWAF